MSTRTRDIAVEAGRAWGADVRTGTAVHVLAGEAWLTFEGDAEDRVLAAGAAFVAPRRGRVAVLALGGAPLALRLAPGGGVSDPRPSAARSAIEIDAKRRARCPS